MVQRQQAFQHLLARGGADGVARAVVLGQGVHVVEGVLQVEVLPAVGIAHGVVQLHVQLAQAQHALHHAVEGPHRHIGWRLRLQQVLAQHAGILAQQLLEVLVRQRQLFGGGGAQQRAVEQVVHIRKPAPAVAHQLLAVLVVALTQGRQRRVGRLPLAGWEGERLEAIARRVT